MAARHAHLPHCAVSIGLLSATVTAGSSIAGSATAASGNASAVGAVAAAAAAAGGVQDGPNIGAIIRANRDFVQASTDINDKVRTTCTLVLTVVHDVMCTAARYAAVPFLVCAAGTALTSSVARREFS